MLGMENECRRSSKESCLWKCGSPSPITLRDLHLDEMAVSTETQLPIGAPKNCANSGSEGIRAEQKEEERTFAD